MSLVKRYLIDENTGKMEENFLEGLYSTKNLAFNIQSDVQYGISVFNVGLSIKAGNDGIFKPTYKLGFRISLFQ